MLIVDMPLLVGHSVAEEQGVHVSLHPSSIRYPSAIITYSIGQFTTIRRIMFSNLVSNSRMGACAEGYTGIAYISLTRDWYYEFVKWL